MLCLDAVACASGVACNPARIVDDQRESRNEDRYGALHFTVAHSIMKCNEFSFVRLAQLRLAPAVSCLLGLRRCQRVNHTLSP
jgi:hypothetical protein